MVVDERINDQYILHKNSEHCYVGIFQVGLEMSMIFADFL